MCTSSQLKEHNQALTGKTNEISQNNNNQQNSGELTLQRILDKLDKIEERPYIENIALKDVIPKQRDG